MAPISGARINVPSQQILRKPVILSTSGGIGICPNSIRPWLTHRLQIARIMT